MMCQVRWSLTFDLCILFFKFIKCHAIFKSGFSSSSSRPYSLLWLVKVSIYTFFHVPWCVNFQCFLHLWQTQMQADTGWTSAGVPLINNRTSGSPVVSDEACQSADILTFNTSGVQYCLQDINHYNSKTGVPELIKKKKRKKKKLWRKYATAVGHSCFIEAQIGIFALSCTGNIHFSPWQLIFVAVVLWFGEFSNLLMVLFVLYACFLLQTRIKS